MCNFDPGWVGLVSQHNSTLVVDWVKKQNVVVGTNDGSKRWSANIIRIYPLYLYNDSFSHTERLRPKTLPPEFIEEEESIGNL